MDGERFTFQDIDADFDEARYLHLQGLIMEAAGLFGDGMGNELGDNAEYERGIVELIVRQAGLPMDFKEQVRAEIYAVARTL